MKVVRQSNGEGLAIPKRGTAGAAGFDLQAAEGAYLLPLERKAIGTGFAWEISAGYVGLICPRSGLAAKQGITVLNAPGIIDSDYRGEVKVLLVNLGESAVSIERGDRIAQMVLTAVAIPKHGLTIGTAMTETERGAGGFGSTGK